MSDAHKVKVEALLHGINAQAVLGSGWLLGGEEAQILVSEFQRLAAENEALKTASVSVVELESLRLSLSEARATGRREGMEEAAKVGDVASKEWEADAALWHKEGMLKTAASSLIHSEAAAKVAAAIRAAMEKAE